MGQKKQKVSLHGSYYSHNFGDLLLLSIYVKWIKEYDSNIEVHMPFAPDSIKDIAGADYNKGIPSILQSNALVYSGGGYFGEQSTNDFKWSVRNTKNHIPPGLLAYIFNRPYAIIGVGFGPLSNKVTRKLMVSLLNKAKTVAVRDQESFDFLIDYGVKNSNAFVTADAVLSLKKEDINEEYIKYAKDILNKLPYKKAVGVHLHVNRSRYKNIELVKDEIIAFSKKCKDVGFVLLSDSYSKYSIINEINIILGDRSLIVPFENPWKLVALISQLDLIVSTKLHVCITAVAMERPVVSFPFHSKTQRFFKQIGANNLCVHLNNVNRGIIKELLAHTIKKNRYSLPNKLREKAEENRQLLNNMLKCYL